MVQWHRESLLLFKCWEPSGASPIEFALRKNAGRVIATQLAPNGRPRRERRFAVCTASKISFLLAVTTTFALLAFASRSCEAQTLSPEQAALVEKAIGREKVLILDIQRRAPMVETYIQRTRPDVKLYQVPVDDQYVLSRVDFGNGFFANP